MVEKALTVYHSEKGLELNQFPKSFAVELENGTFSTSILKGGVHHLSTMKKLPKEFNEIKHFVVNDAFYDEFIDQISAVQEDTIRAKWMFDGAKTIEEIVQILKSQACFYEKMAEQGWKLREPGVEDDYGFVTKPLKYTTFTNEDELKGPVYRAA